VGSRAAWLRVGFGEDVKTIAILLADCLMRVLVKAGSCQADSSELGTESLVSERQDLV